MNLLAIDSPGTFWTFIGVAIAIVGPLLVIWHNRRSAPKPIAENIAFSRSSDFPDWLIVTFTIRNSTNGRWWVEAAHFRSPNGIRVAAQDALKKGPAYDPEIDPSVVDLDSLSNIVALNWELAPAHQAHGSTISGESNAHRFTVWAHHPSRRDDFFSISVILRANDESQKLKTIEFDNAAITSK